ncbi:hypothetical protein GCM10017788_40100 [Amycolatopsis acidiphila]|nr:hypothetical protein GCM10017788_40100 [Amycolatopsis acidiphila]
MITIAVILAGTRPGRAGASVAPWLVAEGARDERARFELLDLAEIALPPLNEPAPPATGSYLMPHTQDWAKTVARFDGYLIVTPEYNRSFPGTLKRAVAGGITLVLPCRGGLPGTCDSSAVDAAVRAGISRNRDAQPGDHPQRARVRWMVGDGRHVCGGGVQTGRTRRGTDCRPGDGRDG